jgi:hypothetical protein
MIVFEEIRVPHVRRSFSASTMGLLLPLHSWAIAPQAFHHKPQGVPWNS